MKKTLSQIRYDASLVLEDPDQRIFTTDILTQDINKSLSIISRYIPYEYKESRFFASTIPEIDISNISNLQNITKAEYEIDQTPRDFRNVSVSGDTATIDTSLTPTAADEVYLFCEKRHSLVDPPSSLAGAVNLLAGYAAGDYSIVLDGLGTGTIMAGTLVYFTDIAGEYVVTQDVEISTNAATIVIDPPLIEAVDDNTVVTFKCSTIPLEVEPILADLTAGYAALNHVGDGRTQIETCLTSIADVNTATDNMTARIAQAVTDIATNRSTLTTMLSTVTTAINLGNARTDQAVTDIQGARTAFNATESNINTAIAAVAARITQAVADLTSGRALINTITTESGAKSDYAGYAARELNAATGKINEAIAFMRQGSNLANQLEAAATRELGASGGYFAEARASLSEFSLACANYGNDASRELSAASAYIGQANGYIREINTRLSLANVLISYSNWGASKIKSSMSELRALQKPRIFVTYPRS